MDLSMSEEELEETMEEVYKKHMNTVQEETMERIRCTSRTKPSGAVAKLPKIKISFPGVRARAAQAARGFENLFCKNMRVASPHPRPCGVESCPPTLHQPPPTPQTPASVHAMRDNNHLQRTFTRESYNHWGFQPATGRSQVIKGSRVSSQQELIKPHDISNQLEYGYRLHPQQSRSFVIRE